MEYDTFTCLIGSDIHQDWQLILKKVIYLIRKVQRQINRFEKRKNGK